jgi:hypothetical protein
VRLLSAISELKKKEKIDLLASIAFHVCESPINLREKAIMIPLFDNISPSTTRRGGLS